jgi:hypothetical protein
MRKTMAIGRDLYLSTVMAVLLGACSSSSSSTGQPDASTGGTGDASVAGSGGSGNASAAGGTGPAGTGAAGAGAAGAGGAGAGGAGAGGAGAADASGGTGGVGTDGAPPRPACRTGAFANVLFCDDFESGLTSWRHLQSPGTDGETSLSTSLVHGGRRAVRSTKSASGVLDPLYADVLGRRTTGKLFVRVWIFIPNSTVISPGGNASILVLGEGPPADGGVSVALWETGATIQVYDPNATPQYAQAASFQTTLPRERWFCAQLDFPIGAQVSNLDFNLRVDGTKLGNAEPQTNVDSVLTSPYDRLWLGVNYINELQSSAVTVHYDDLFVDTKEVGCE